MENYIVLVGNTDQILLTLTCIPDGAIPSHPQHSSLPPLSSSPQRDPFWDLRVSVKSTNTYDSSTLFGTAKYNQRSINRILHKFVKKKQEIYL